MATLRSRRINGALAFWETHRNRLIDVIGGDVIKYIDDFTFGPGIDANFDADWTITRVEGGAGESTISRIDGGYARITTDDAENDGINAQLIGSIFELTADQQLYFGAFDCIISDATQSDFFLGLAVTDTDILGGVTDRIGFEKLDGATALKFMLEKDSTETLSSSLATLANATAFDIEFYWNGSAISVYLNGSSVLTPAITNLPNDVQMRLSWQYLAGAAASKTMDIDKLAVIQIGR